MTVHDLFIETGGSVKYRIECWENYICLDSGIIDDFDFQKSRFNNKEIQHITIDNNTLIVLVN